MERKHKILSITALSCATLLTAAVIVASKPAFAQNALAVKRSADISSSITFTNFNNVDGVAQATTSLSNGGTVRAYSTRAHSNHDAVVSSTQFLFFAYVDNGVDNDSVSAEGSSRTMAPFQGITGIKATFNGTGTLCFNTSTDGTSFSQKTLSSSDVKYTVTSSKYCYFSVSGSGTRYLTSVTLYYSCSTEGGGGGEEPTGLSGTYTNSYCALHFTSNTQGYFTRESYEIYFIYAISGDAITFTYVSGDNAACGNYRLFDGGDDPVPNATGKVASETQVKLKTYGPWGATDRTFTKS